MDPVPADSVKNNEDMTSLYGNMTSEQNMTSQNGTTSGGLGRDEDLAKLEIAVSALIFALAVLGNGLVLIILLTRRYGLGLSSRKATFSWVRFALVSSNPPPPTFPHPESSVQPMSFTAPWVRPFCGGVKSERRVAVHGSNFGDWQHCGMGDNAWKWHWGLLEAQMQSRSEYIRPFGVFHADSSLGPILFTFAFPIGRTLWNKVVFFFFQISTHLLRSCKQQCKSAYGTLFQVPTKMCSSAPVALSWSSKLFEPPGRGTAGENTYRKTTIPRQPPFYAASLKAERSHACWRLVVIDVVVVIDHHCFHTRLTQPLHSSSITFKTLRVLTLGLFLWILPSSLAQCQKIISPLNLQLITRVSKGALF